MDRAKQREIASKGGKAAHQKGTAHEWTSEEARDAGRKGGIASHQRRREQTDGPSGESEIALDRSSVSWSSDRDSIDESTLSRSLLQLTLLRSRAISLSPDGPSVCSRRRWWLAIPPFRPASRASSLVHSCAVPFWCAALPPLLAISRCFARSIDANPRSSFATVPPYPYPRVEDLDCN